MESTIKDVARVAGVSTATVSRVLNGAVSVSDSTRIRVLKVVSRLEYSPNPHAAELGRAKGESSIENRRHMRTVSASIAKPIFDAGSDLQKAQLEEMRLKFLEGEYSRLTRVVAKLNKDLERLRRVSPRS